MHRIKIRNSHDDICDKFIFKHRILNMFYSQFVCSNLKNRGIDYGTVIVNTWSNWLDLNDKMH